MLLKLSVIFNLKKIALYSQFKYFPEYHTNLKLVLHWEWDSDWDSEWDSNWDSNWDWFKTKFWSLFILNSNLITVKIKCYYQLNIMIKSYCYLFLITVKINCYDVGLQIEHNA